MRAGSRHSSGRTARLAVPLAFLAGLLMAPELSADSSGVVVDDAWIRMAPPVIKVHAGYLTLSNHGPAERHLIAVESPAYARAEMHISREVNGVATMEHLAQVTVPPGKPVAFAPGSLHLMLMGAKDKQSEGATVPLTLIFQNGARIAVKAVVRNDIKMGGHAGHDRHGM